MVCADILLAGMAIVFNVSKHPLDPVLGFQEMLRVAQIIHQKACERKLITNALAQDGMGRTAKQLVSFDATIVARRRMRAPWMRKTIMIAAWTPMQGSSS